MSVDNTLSSGSESTPTGGRAAPTPADVRRIAALPPGPVQDFKRILSRRAGSGLDQAMAQETAATVRGFLDPGTAKRIAAFG
mgnify:CR=1 FL=1